MGTWGHHNAEMGTCGRGDMLVRLGPGQGRIATEQHERGGAMAEPERGVRRRTLNFKKKKLRTIRNTARALLALALVAYLRPFLLKA